MGKTVTVLTVIDILRLVGDVRRPVLILAPLRVAQTTWPDEVKKWSHTAHLRVSPILGTESERCAALMRPAEIYTINYENIPWLIKYYAKRGHWPFDMIVADESTKLKGFRLNQGAKRARDLARVAFKSSRFINLTGTPAPNGLIDLWGQTWFLDGGERLGRTFTAFIQRWFEKSYDGYSFDPRPNAQKEIEERLKDICLSLNPADYFDLEEPIKVPVEVDIPHKARAIYKDMEKTMFAELGDLDEIEAVNAAARTMKCLQLANGAAYVDEKATIWKEIHDVKIKALEDIIEEAAGMPVLCAYNFRSDLDRLRRAFPKGRLLDKQPQTLRDWNAGKIPLLFAHPASAGHGLNLQDGGNILVFFSVNWNLEEHEQIIERIGPVRQKQAGYDRPVFIYYIMVKNTVERLVMERLESKASIQEILMQAMKARKENELC